MSPLVRWNACNAWTPVRFDHAWYSDRLVGLDLRTDLADAVIDDG
jgi:hypothetical protein